MHDIICVVYHYFISHINCKYGDKIVIEQVLRSALNILILLLKSEYVQDLLMYILYEKDIAGDCV